MPLTPGTKLGQYEVIESIGAGGMGEVYRARDTKLGRDVAIKVLPEEFARDKERLDRFEREARLLAQLNHANIATLHGLEEHDGQQFLVMELVEGETLAERIAQGPIPINEAIPLFIQIAEGLEAAHEKGIIHRDLKPANIKIDPEGKPKILDFGLAKGGFVEDVESESPTVTRQGTETGRILGTAVYMSPEQARGRTLDKRTDIWSFGCVLYEAITGVAPFLGETVSDTIARILEREPDWEALPKETPVVIRALLRRCLRKDPERRLHDVADARLEIEEELESPESIKRKLATKTTTSQWHGVGWAAFGAATATLLLTVLPSKEPNNTDSTLARFTLRLPASESIELTSVRAWQQPSIAFSPDGSRVVYVSRTTASPQLQVRELAQREATPIAGSEDQGTHCPFFSPDGESVAYFTSGELRRVSLSTNATVTLAETLPVSSGGSWGVDGFIYFSDAPVKGLLRVAATGGVPERLTEPDVASGERGHFYPVVLPDRKHVLFTIRTTGGWNNSRIAVLSLETGGWRTLIEGGTSPHYLHPGYLVYAQAGRLFVTRFDVRQLSVADSTVQVLDGLRTREGAEFSISQNGSLVYLASRGRTAERALVWVDRNGQVEPLDLPLAEYSFTRLSPDGERVATVILDEDGHSNVWVAELTRRTLTKLTPGGGLHYSTAWTPDGQRIAFSWRRGSDPPELYSKSPDGSLDEERLNDMPYAQFATSWSPEGSMLAFNYEHPETKFDIYLLEPGSEPRPFRATQFNESGAMFSPDGRWLAYESDESGRTETYIRPVSGPGGMLPVSRVGGREPLWAPNGGELFFRHLNQIFVVDVETGSELRLGEPRLLYDFEDAIPGGLNIPTYDVAPDGQRFLTIQKSQEERSPAELNVVLNWIKEVKQLVPADD